MSGGIFSPDILLEKQGGYMTYHRLENSIIDVIKEEQAKLGYRKEEIRFIIRSAPWITFLRQRRMQRR